MPKRLLAVVVTTVVLAACGTQEANLSQQPQVTTPVTTAAAAIAVRSTATAPSGSTPTTTAAAMAVAPSASTASQDVSRQASVAHDITYCKAAGRALTMDVYAGRQGGRLLPAVVYIHGGGWAGGDKSEQEAMLDIPELVKRNFVVASINYRYAPQYRFPAQIKDAKCAIRSLRAHAADYGIDPQHIGVLGSSAGAHIGLLVALASSAKKWDVGEYTDQSSAVQAAIDLFGPTDLQAIVSVPDQVPIINTAFGTSDAASAVLKRASPITYVARSAPPILIIHGDKDAVVPPEQSTKLYDRLQASGAHAQLVLVKHAGHNFAAVDAPIDPSHTELTKMMVDFFDNALK
ncbi:MAG: hypothetical protein NVS4B8_08440 [Herpetosiphon sp.]